MYRRLVFAVLTVLAIGLLAGAAMTTPSTAGSTPTGVLSSGIAAGASPPIESAVTTLPTASAGNTITTTDTDPITTDTLATETADKKPIRKETTDNGTNTTGKLSETANPANTAASQPASAGTLSNAMDEQTVIVRLTEQSAGTIRTTDHENRIRSMQAHAETTQSAFRRFTEGNPHVEIERSFWLTNAIVVSVNTDRIPLQRLGTVNNVERVHENYNLSVTTTATPTATSTITSQPWDLTHSLRIQQSPRQQQVAQQLEPTTIQTTDGLAQINVPGAWEYTKGATTSIAVLDTGVDPSHPDIDIDPANWNDWDTDGNPRDTAPQDYGRHGTHVSGTAVGGDASGTAIGVAPKAELYHGAALTQNCNDRCEGTVAQLLAGMEWAVEQDVAVLSMSLGGTEKSDNFIDDMVPAVRNAEDAGTVVVAATGNSGADTSTSPGNVYDSISVGATRPDHTVADFSGSETVNSDAWDDPPADWPETYPVPTVVAPGVKIQSSVPGGEYEQFSGTSMATPHVAGTAALIQAESNESVSPKKIRSILESTAVDTGDEQIRQGAGQIDAEAAVEAVVSQPNFSVDITNVPISITTGQQLTVDYTVKNTGDKAGGKQVVLRLDGKQIDATTTETLDPDDSISGTFTYQTTSSDVGTRTLTVESEDISASRTIEIVEPVVRLANTSLEPSSVTSGSTNNYTLTTDIYNISDDDQPEMVTITLPSTLTLTKQVNTTDITAIDTNEEIIDVSVEELDDNTIILSMSPDTDAELQDLTLAINFTGRV